MLKVKNLHKSFGGVKAVNHCSFEVRKGVMAGLIGPNGAGKTTMFNLISGFLDADEGSIEFNGHDVSDMGADQRARLGLGRTFQAIRVFPELSALENVVLAFPENKRKFLDVWRRGGRRLRRELEDKAEKLLERVGILKLANMRASQLSYGQQKLLEIARTIAMEAEMILMDEPAAGINPSLLKEIGELIRDLNKEGKTILLVEHNIPFVMEMCEEVIVLDYGKELAVGTPEEIQNNPKVIEAYLGKSKNA